MKNLILCLVIIFYSSFFAQNVVNKKASGLFFLNNIFGVLVKANNTIAVTSNGGISWTQINIDTDESLSKVLFTSESRGWLLSGESVFNTIDGGMTWMNNHSFVGEHLQSLYFINDEIGFIGASDTGPIIYITKNSGKSWIRATLDTIFYSGIMDFSFINDSVGIAVNNFTIYKTKDGGLSWTGLPIYFYVEGSTPESGTMLDADNIILRAWYPYVVAEGYLLSSIDGGITWDRFGNGQAFKWGIVDDFILNKDSIWLSTGISTYFTEDGGNNWDTLDVRLSAFSFFSNSQAYGLSDNYFLYTDDGWSTYTIIDSTVTSLDEIINSPQTFKLDQNIPNPFNPVTNIRFEIPLSLEVKLVIYDILGRKVETLLNEYLQTGIYETEFNAQNLTSGIYFYRIISGSYSETKKMILLR